MKRSADNQTYSNNVKKAKTDKVVIDLTKVELSNDMFVTSEIDENFFLARSLEKELKEPFDAKQVDKIISLYEDCANSGHALAHSRLALIYSNDKYGKVDMAKAYNYHLKAVTFNVGRCYYYYGRFMENITDILIMSTDSGYKYSKIAYDIYKKGADLGDIACLACVGTYYVMLACLEDFESNYKIAVDYGKAVMENSYDDLICLYECYKLFLNLVEIEYRKYEDLAEDLTIYPSYSQYMEIKDKIIKMGYEPDKLIYDIELL